jgi:GT2 family glycosyltransferase
MPPPDLVCRLTAGIPVDAGEPATGEPRRGVSIVICTHRRARSVERCLDSIGKQTRRPACLLIVDSSPDRDTEERIRRRDDLTRLAGRFEYVRVGGQLAGLTRQRNFGLRHVTTDLVAFFDDDVVLAEGCLAAMEAAHRRDAAIVGVGAVAVNERRGLTRLWRARRALGVVDSLRAGRYCRSGVSVSWGLLDRAEPTAGADWLPGYAMMWKTTIARQVGFDEGFEGYANGEDLDFGLRMAQRGRLVIATGARLVHHHEQSGRPDAYALGFSTIHNAWQIHRRCLRPRGLLDVSWFGYAFTLDTLIQCAAVLSPPGPSWRLAYGRGRMACLVSLLRHRGTVARVPHRASH